MALGFRAAASNIFSHKSKIGSGMISGGTWGLMGGGVVGGVSSAASGENPFSGALSGAIGWGAAGAIGMGAYTGVKGKVWATQMKANAGANVVNKTMHTGKTTGEVVSNNYFLNSINPAAGKSSRNAYNTTFLEQNHTAGNIIRGQKQFESAGSIADFYKKNPIRVDKKTQKAIKQNKKNRKKK